MFRVRTSAVSVLKSSLDHGFEQVELCPSALFPDPNANGWVGNGKAVVVVVDRAMLLELRTAFGIREEGPADPSRLDISSWNGPFCTSTTSILLSVPVLVLVPSAMR